MKSIQHVEMDSWVHELDLIYFIVENRSWTSDLRVYKIAVRSSDQKADERSSKVSSIVIVIIVREKQ
jgi:hypothetical protein